MVLALDCHVAQRPQSYAYSDSAQVEVPHSGLAGYCLRRESLARDSVCAGATVGMASCCLRGLTHNQYLGVHVALWHSMHVADRQAQPVDHCNGQLAKVVETLPDARGL